MSFDQSQRENSGSITSKSGLRKVYSLLGPNIAEKSKGQNIEKRTQGPRRASLPMNKSGMRYTN